MPELNPGTRQCLSWADFTPHSENSDASLCLRSPGIIPSDLVELRRTVSKAFLCLLHTAASIDIHVRKSIKVKSMTNVCVCTCRAVVWISEVLKRQPGYSSMLKSSFIVACLHLLYSVDLLLYHKMWLYLSIGYFIETAQQCILIIR